MADTGPVVDPNPLPFVVLRAREETEQRRIPERALAESEPMDRARGVPPVPHDDDDRVRGLPVMAKGVGGTKLGTERMTVGAANAARTAWG
jgi:hypothetical protein